MDRLFRAFSIAVVLFFVVLGIVVGSRMDQTTIALLGGVLIGLLIAIPCTALITLIAVRSRASSLRAEPPAWGPPMPNPYYVVAPPVQQVSTLPPTQHNFPTTIAKVSEPFSLPPRRKFYLIGESGDTSEIQPDSDHNTISH